MSYLFRKEVEFDFKNNKKLDFYDLSIVNYQQLGQKRQHAHPELSATYAPPYLI